MSIRVTVPAFLLFASAAIGTACGPMHRHPTDAGSDANPSARAATSPGDDETAADDADDSDDGNVTADAEDAGPSLSDLYPSLGDEEVAPTPELEEEQQDEDKFLDQAPSIAGVKLDPRVLAAEYDIPIEVTPMVEQFIVYFQTRGRKYYATWLSRSGRYLPMMRRVFKENGLPEDLTYLAMIESGFSNKAWSRTRASGPWQFMKGTGGRYGLGDDWWVDERRDPELATRAAAQHLKDLYEEFGDWYLAAAAYNAGAGKIHHAIEKYGSRNFWELCKAGRYLRRETKQYVPKLLAAAIIAKQPAKFGFSGIEYLDPLDYETVVVPDATDLRVVAECAGADYDSVCELNPALKRMCTPPGGTYEVRVPAGTSASFAESYARLDPKRRVTFRRHRVARGETPSEIARRYGTDVEGILRMNHIRSARSLRANQDLIIPVPVGNHGLTADLKPLPDGRSRRGTRTRYANEEDNEKIQRSIAAAEAEAPKNAPRPDFHDDSPRDDRRRARVVEGRDFTPPANREKVKVTLAMGDTLWGISQRYGVTVSQIKHWNGILNHRSVQAGSTVTLYVTKANLAAAGALASAEAKSATSARPDSSVADDSNAIRYRVKKGDTLWDIAREHNVDPVALMKENGLSRHSKIRPGDVIRIASDH